ncbi:hypothetical protein [Peribacillus simplex]|uniref:hypothetical protein n=1 Tax=Peribacillus simplex TaxID=1478 RepID=UPI003D274BEA
MSGFLFFCFKIKHFTSFIRFDGDATNLMIKHGWFERLPQTIDREYLAKEINK